ncbi:MAG: hypothetical protein ACI9J2_000798 [Saprospiraceae bacterium]|jgi:hypothetical protein
MNLLIVVSTANALEALLGLSAACLRGGQTFSCFVTGEGVRVLGDPSVVGMLESSQHVVVCEYSWNRYFSDNTLPFEGGSQTDHSAMISEADQVVSL